MSHVRGFCPTGHMQAGTNTPRVDAGHYWQGVWAPAAPPKHCRASSSELPLYLRNGHPGEVTFLVPSLRLTTHKNRTCPKSHPPGPWKGSSKSTLLTGTKVLQPIRSASNTVPLTRAPVPSLKRDQWQKRCSHFHKWLPWPSTNAAHRSKETQSS